MALPVLGSPLIDTVALAGDASDLQTSSSVFISSSTSIVQADAPTSKTLSPLSPVVPPDQLLDVAAAADELLHVVTAADLLLDVVAADDTLVPMAPPAPFASWWPISWVSIADAIC
jgi:hypothetical protein